LGVRVYHAGRNDASGNRKTVLRDGG